MKNNELSGISDNGYEEWLKKLESMSDIEICYEMHNRVMEKSDIDEESKELFDLAFNYCMKLIIQKKPLESNLLKIYLQDIHHKDINQINMVLLVTLLSLCGINFSQKDV